MHSRSGLLVSALAARFARQRGWLARAYRLARDLFRKPVPTFRDHALACALAIVWAGAAYAQAVTADFSKVEPNGKYTFASATPKTLPDLVKGVGLDQTTNIAGHLFLPKGKEKEKVPAVILMHGSGGIYSAMLEFWPKQFNDAGIAVFSVDSFGPRGVKSTAEDQSQVPFAADLVDAFAALKLLATHPRIDPQRIAIMGFSRGGNTSLARGGGAHRRLAKAAGQFAVRGAHPALYGRLHGSAPAAGEARNFRESADAVHPRRRRRLHANRAMPGVRERDRQGRDARRVHHDQGRASQVRPGRPEARVREGRAAVRSRTARSRSTSRTSGPSTARTASGCRARRFRRCRRSASRSGRASRGTRPPATRRRRSRSDSCVRRLRCSG